jgi:hypothetical protein
MLCSDDAGHPDPEPRDAKRRNVHVQEQMSFLRDPSPPGSARVWDALDDEGKSEVVAVLARVIARVALDPLGTDRRGREEETDE